MRPNWEWTTSWCGRVSPESLPQLILDQALAFSQGTLQDDLAVLALSPREIVGNGSGRASRKETLLG
jgi:hypothetical protein